MKYVVRLQKSSVSFAETIIDAENRSEAQNLAELTVNSNDLSWEETEESCPEVIDVEEIFVLIREPLCPHCGSQNFRELQTVYEAQKVSWNADGNFLEYGNVEFQEMESVTGIECASCGKDLGEDFFQPWHQGKTRSEIYGEHETTNNTKGEDQHD
jgi:predicted RNA-binding Zn-ribbon protein involved in translation (DUF1610 family)